MITEVEARLLAGAANYLAGRVDESALAPLLRRLAESLLKSAPAAEQIAVRAARVAGRDATDNGRTLEASRASVRAAHSGALRRIGAGIAAQHLARLRATS